MVFKPCFFSAVWKFIENSSFDQHDTLIQPGMTNFCKQCPEKMFVHNYPFEASADSLSSVKKRYVKAIGLKRGVIWFIPLVRSPRATHEGNKSHNLSLQGDKWLICTLARIPQGMQKYTEEKCPSFFCCSTIHAGTAGSHQFLGFLNMLVY